MEWLANAMLQHRELALFLTLAIGYALSRIRFGSVQLGAVSGVLITGVLIGQLGIAISPDLKSCSASVRAPAPPPPASPPCKRSPRAKIPTLGYGVTYAIGNVLLALWGSVMVVLMAR